MKTAMHVIDYKIHGDDMQFVEIELDPAEAVVAASGAMMFMDDGVATAPAKFRADGIAAWSRSTPVDGRIALHDGL